MNNVGHKRVPIYREEKKFKLYIDLPRDGLKFVASELLSFIVFTMVKSKLSPSHNCNNKMHKWMKANIYKLMQNKQKSMGLQLMFIPIVKKQIWLNLGLTVPNIAHNGNFSPTNRTE